MSDTPTNGGNGLKRARSSSPVNGATSSTAGGKKQNTGKESSTRSQSPAGDAAGAGGDPSIGGTATSTTATATATAGSGVMDTSPVTNESAGNNHGLPAAPAPAAAGGDAGTGDASPTITIRALIVTQDASIIIGKAGSHIKEIREKAGAKVSVTEALQGNPERILMVTGPLDAVSKAYGLIVRKINDEPYDSPSVPGSRAVTIKYIVPNNRMGSVIGKGGSKIKEIQEASGARLQASEAMLPGSTERILSVSGVADAIHIAVYYVGTILQEVPERATANTAYRPTAAGYGASSPYGGQAPSSSSSRYPPSGSSGPSFYPPGGSQYGGPPPSSYSGPASAVGGGGAPGGVGNSSQHIYIPNELVGNIIGKGGQKINEIRQLSNCSIKIMETHEGQGSGARENERLVTITGLPHNISTAVQMLHARLESERTKKVNAGNY